MQITGNHEIKEKIPDIRKILFYLRISIRSLEILHTRQRVTNGYSEDKAGIFYSDRTFYNNGISQQILSEIP